MIPLGEKSLCRASSRRRTDDWERYNKMVIAGVSVVAGRVSSSIYHRRLR